MRINKNRIYKNPHAFFPRPLGASKNNGAEKEKPAEAG